MTEKDDVEINPKSKNKININDLIIKEVDRSIDMRGRIESKAVGSMSAVALILNIVLNFIIESRKLTICINFKVAYMLFYIATFLIGVTLLLFFVLMLFPQKTGYFDADLLFKLRENKEKENNDADSKIISECEQSIAVNDDTMNRMLKFNRRISYGLVALAICFVVDTILFFVSINGGIL